MHIEFGLIMDHLEWGKHPNARRITAGVLIYVGRNIYPCRYTGG
jgi:hypothetical protein